MGKKESLFSFRNLFVVSLALNCSFVLKLLISGEDRCDPKFASMEAVEATSPLVPAVASTIQIPEDMNRIINVDHGDPTMYEDYWRQMGDKTTIVIPGWQSLSYFSDITNFCWFLEPELKKQIIRLHSVVGNAVTKDHHIVVGTGSSQLFQAALYALSPPDAHEPISVVSAAPYYSCYPLITDCVKSGLFKWGGDARSFNKEGPYIEIVTAPNNPDGNIMESVVNRSGGLLVHDLAYYWPQYTPISSKADHDIMLFTVSKCTGHAGTRIGWALVKDQEVAKKMTKYIEINTIGVSKDSQLRAAKVLEVTSESIEQSSTKSFFSSSYDIMATRWKLFREAVKTSGQFSVSDVQSKFCNFRGHAFKTQTAFAWLKCEGEISDCESYLKENKIVARNGKHFGSSSKYVRISMVDRENNFNLLVKRLASIRSKENHSL